ncbi:hypothetical protein A9F13_01g05170 [Clavispora lusitaniae]|uniref:Arrestin-like N-terminal domain-containing protein n=1 Tax=Clavispora lusitaniae TaxID=36911 RepID=A0AA91Q4E9_CLALS|nr:hypothetical protein A9F13_01g05170 [Clavispora lusitaniae]
MGHDIEIEIEEPQDGRYFTNFDVVKGRVKVSTTTSLTLSYIQVKLEGVSATEVHIPEDKEKKIKEKTLRDVHKVLYETAIVFPPTKVREVSATPEFTLNEGIYTYPFEFQIPRDSSCYRSLGTTSKSIFNKVAMSIENNGNGGRTASSNSLQSLTKPNAYSQNLQRQRQSLEECAYHIKGPLPPSFSHGVAADIHYYVKVTCKRPSLIKANLRATSTFQFLPFDFERTPRLIRNSSAPSVPSNMHFRRAIDFASSPPPPPPKVYENNKKGKKEEKHDKKEEKKLEKQQQKEEKIRQKEEKKEAKRIAKAKKKGWFNPPPPPPAPVIKQVPPFAAEVRVSKDKGFVRGMMPSMHILFAMDANPEIYAAPRNEKNRLPDDTAISYELEISPSYYDNCRIPLNLPPSFQTCNVTRFYNLAVRLTVSREAMQASSSRVQALTSVEVVCPDVRLSSGIDPPPPLYPPRENQSVNSRGQQMSISTGSSSSVTNPFTDVKSPEGPGSPGFDSSQPASPVAVSSGPVSPGPISSEDVPQLRSVEEESAPPAYKLVDDPSSR